MSGFDDEPDEDFLLAMKLAADEAENDYIKRKRETEANDFELALKLSKELNSTVAATALSNSDPKDVSEVINIDDFDGWFNESDDTRPKATRNFSYKSNENLVNMDLDYDAGSDSVLAVHLSQLNDSTPRKVRKNGETDEEASSSYSDQNISVVDPLWENIDPNPDIYALFMAFNRRFFWGQLEMVEVKWSSRMTLCAGICSYNERAGHCTVKLSIPLLKLRPRKDLVETLLHEMIHAYLFVTHNDRDRDGHGPRFHSHMYRINKESGSNITVYHSFHEEVKVYKTHWWRCDGSCRNRAPFFGFVKRASNRAPGPNDTWYAAHRATCGGTFVKVKEPEDYSQKKKKSSPKTKINNSGGDHPDISRYLVKARKLPVPAASVSSSSLSNDSKASSQILSCCSSSSYAPVIPVSFATKKVFTLSDLSKSPKKRSPVKSPNKWVPLSGQSNILHFIKKS